MMQVDTIMRAYAFSTTIFSIIYAKNCFRNKFSHNKNNHFSEKFENKNALRKYALGDPLWSEYTEVKKPLSK